MSASLGAINALNFEAFTIKEVLYVCKKYGCYAVCRGGGLSALCLHRTYRRGPL